MSRSEFPGPEFASDKNLRIIGNGIALGANKKKKQNITGLHCLSVETVQRKCIV